MNKKLLKMIEKEFEEKYQSFELGEPVNFIQFSLLRKVIYQIAEKWRKEGIEEAYKRGYTDGCFDQLKGTVKLENTDW